MNVVISFNSLILNIMFLSDSDATDSAFYNKLIHASLHDLILDFFVVINKSRVNLRKEDLRIKKTSKSLATLFELIVINHTISRNSSS